MGMLAHLIVSRMHMIRIDCTQKPLAESLQSVWQ